MGLLTELPRSHLQLSPSRYQVRGPKTARRRFALSSGTQAPAVQSSQTPKPAAPHRITPRTNAASEPDRQKLPEREAAPPRNEPVEKSPDRTAARQPQGPSVPPVQAPKSSRLGQQPGRSRNGAPCTGAERAALGYPVPGTRRTPYASFRTARPKRRPLAFRSDDGRFTQCGFARRSRTPPRGLGQPERNASSGLLVQSDRHPGRCERTGAEHAFGCEQLVGQRDRLADRLFAARPRRTARAYARVQRRSFDARVALPRLAHGNLVPGARHVAPPPYRRGRGRDAAGR